MKKSGFIKAVTVSVLLLVMTAILFGCSENKADQSVVPEIYYNSQGEIADIAYEKSANKSNISTVDNSIIVTTSDRILVYTVEENLSVKNVSETVMKITSETEKVGGYISYTRQSDGGYASVTARIPTEKLVEFLNGIETVGTVNSKNVSCDDITERYVDTEERINTLKVQKEKYEAMLQEAKTVSEAITINEKIDRIDDEIKSYSATLSSYKRQVDYSKVNFSLYEEGTYVEPDFWDEMGELFVESGSSVGDFFRGVITVIVAVAPYFVLMGGLFGLYVLVKFIVCKARKKPFVLFRRAKERRAIRKNRRQQKLNEIKKENKEEE